jgi:predicted dehydrogenase
VQLVIVATRHDQHAAMALAALAAGTHVLVEKPLALSESELARIEAFFAARTQAPILMTGFNRRFAPAVRRLQRELTARSAPLLVNYRMNAGYLPDTHWAHGPEGGGRNIGEACHIYDLFQAVTGATWTECTALALAPRTGAFRPADNFVATARYADGSLCTLTYTALGARDYPKERMDVFCDGAVWSLDDYRALTVAGRAPVNWASRAAEKGQLEELRELARALREGGPWPIPLADQLAAMRLAFAVEERLGAPRSRTPTLSPAE